jgi:serine/threonine protein kinase
MTKCACGTEIGIGASLASPGFGRLCPRCVLADALAARGGGGADPARGLAGLALGGYDVVDVIASGAMGTVYRARQRALDRLVALKVLAIPGHAEATERFLREARAR